MTGRQHYLCEFHLDDKCCWVVWFSGEHEPDGLMVNDSHKLFTFASYQQAIAFTVANAIAVDDDDEATPVYDFDTLAQWGNSPSASQIDCVAFLNAWNMLADMVASVGGSSDFFKAADASLNTVYEKLFLGNNLPAVTDKGEHYRPAWDAQELSRLALLFRLGIQELRAALSV